MTCPPAALAMSSIIRDVERLAAAEPVCLLNISLAASARVYSSPMYVPASSTIARRSASGSCAKPMSACAFFTASQSDTRFSAVGSGGCANKPVGSVLTGVILQPRAVSSFTPGRPPAPLTLSRTTLNCFLAIAFCVNNTKDFGNVNIIRFVIAGNFAWFERVSRKQNPC